MPLLNFIQGRVLAQKHAVNRSLNLLVAYETQMHQGFPQLQAH